MTLAALSEAARFVRDAAPWDWFVTLTFCEDVTEAHARWALRAWLRGVARRMVTGHVKVAWGVERTRSDRVHLHLVLHCVENGARFDVTAARAAWLKTSTAAGTVTKFTRFRAEEHGPEYVVKDGDWDVAVVCSRRPRCRRPGRSCVFGREHW